MNLPLIVLAILSAFGGIALVNFLHPFIAPVTYDLVKAAEGAREAAGEAHHAWSFASMAQFPALCGLVAGILGAGRRVRVGPERFAQGWSPGGGSGSRLPPERLRRHALVHLREGRRCLRAGALLVRQDDRRRRRQRHRLGHRIPGRLLRTLQTGYVRNYALVMLAGAVFVVACFMLILQHPSSSAGLLGSRRDLIRNPQSAILKFHDGTLLQLVIYLPLAAGIILAFLPKEQLALIKVWAIGATALTFAISVAWR